MKVGKGQMMSAALLLAGVLSAGCERWPWESSAKAGATASTASSSRDAAATPRASSIAGQLVVPAQERVATVNQVAVSTADVELALTELKRFVQAAQQEWKPLPTDARPNELDLTDVMDNLIDSELKTQDARARGLDRQTDIQRHLTYLERNFYAQEWDRWQRERSAPTEEEVHAFYEDNKAAFVDPERIHVRQLVSETREQAESIRARVVQGESFEQLARELSVGAGKQQGGDIGWHLRALDKERLRLIGKANTDAVFFPQLEPIAFALEEKGQLSQPVKGPDGRVYVVSLVERVVARQQSELEVHDAMKELLTLKNLNSKLEALRAKTGTTIERFPERLKDVSQ